MAGLYEGADGKLYATDGSGPINGTARPDKPLADRAEAGEGFVCAGCGNGPDYIAALRASHDALVDKAEALIRRSENFKTGALRVSGTHEFRELRAALATAKELSA